MHYFTQRTVSTVNSKCCVSMWPTLNWYVGLSLGLHNCNGLVAPRQSLYNFCFISLGLFLCSGCVPCSSSAHRVPGKMAAVPIYKVLVRPGGKSNSDALTTRPWAGTLNWTRPHLQTELINTKQRSARVINDVKHVSR